MDKQKVDIPDGEVCKICGAPAVEWDDTYYHGYTCGQHRREYTLSMRHVEAMRMSLAFEEQRRNFDPNAPYQPYVPSPLPGPSAEFAALRLAMEGSSKEMLEKGGDVLPYGAAVDRDGKIVMIVIRNLEGETRGHVLDNVIGNLVELAGPRGFRAVGFASSGHGMNPATGEQSRMILIHLEDAGGYCRTVMVPFSRGVLPGTWVCAPARDQEAEAVVYPAVRGTG